ncbi:MAG: low molecular weight protein-tyrosine-phosphatase [Pseudomonadota bacterium]|nr:MAG: phosphotyrosine protein phosphatase [Pseudomonadota bacterium]
MVSVCFVCLGNICRSPTAEGVFRHIVRRAGLEHAFFIDSAGTAAYHAGEPPDVRASAAAKRRGIELSGRARRFEDVDFERFDYVLAMDLENLRSLQRRAPKRARCRIALLRSFDPSAEPNAAVPDPYYGGDEGFEHVLDLCLSACEGLLAHIRREHGL